MTRRHCETEAIKDAMNQTISEFIRRLGDAMHKVEEGDLLDGMERLAEHLELFAAKLRRAAHNVRVMEHKATMDAKLCETLERIAQIGGRVDVRA